MTQPWIDTHIHVSDIDPKGEERERLLEDLLDVLDRCDADLRLVVSCDTPHIYRIASDARAMLPANQMIHELCRQAPDRLFGSCCINPNFLDESLRVMDICLGEWGFVMLGEMLQYVMNYRMDSDETEQVVRRALRYEVPVQVHLGTYWHRNAGVAGAGMDQLGDLMGIAERVPEANYILAHAIGCGPTPEYLSWADMFLDAIAAYFPEYPENFWVEIRDFHCPALPRTISQIPPHRLLAGTDWTTRIGPPFQTYGTMFDVAEADNPFPPAVASFAGFLRDAGASEDDISRIACGNAGDLFGIASRANGSASIK